MTVIADIRIYRCTVENVTGVWPEGFASKELNAVARRICMKLRENNFSMGDFSHLYINLSTCLPVGEVKHADKTPDRYHPWYHYYDVGISRSLYDSLETPDCIPLVSRLIEKVLKTQFSTLEFDEDKISACVSEAVTQGADMLMRFKEKTSAQRRAVLYLRLLDNCNYFPLLRVYDNDDNIVFERALPESLALDDYGQITVSSKKVTIRPRKNSWTDGEPIEFVL